ncbi:MAG TPA: hypothetical protein VF156_15635 [Agromyces sp.]
MRHTLYALRMAAWRLLTGRQRGVVRALPPEADCKVGTQLVLLEPRHPSTGGREDVLTLFELFEQPCDAPDGGGVVMRRVWTPLHVERRPAVR